MEMTHRQYLSFRLIPSEIFPRKTPKKIAPEVCCGRLSI
jgi:hypothetical protein